jgi:hypothetical protein
MVSALSSYIIIIYRRGVPYSLFEMILKYLSLEECSQKLHLVCKPWKRFYAKLFWSYSSFPHIETNKLSAKDLKIIFDKGTSSLVHVSSLQDIIRKDFKGQVKFFHSKIVLHATVADRLFSLRKRTD